MVTCRLTVQDRLIALSAISRGRQRAAVLVAVMALMYACPPLFVIGLTATIIYLLPSHVAMLCELWLRRYEARSYEAETTRLRYGRDTAIARLDELDGELADAKRQLAEKPGAVDPLYRRVGLSDGCPNFVVAAARKAYRLKLHPDRVPERLKIAAHARFVAAEAAFAEIERRRK